MDDHNTTIVEKASMAYYLRKSIVIKPMDIRTEENEEYEKVDDLEGEMDPKDIRVKRKNVKETANDNWCSKLMTKTDQAGLLQLG